MLASMPKIGLNDAIKNKLSTPADQIVAIAKALQCSAPAKAAHLVNLSLATLKYLMVNAESDAIRYQAATALLGLAPMQAKLGLMRGVVDQPHLGRDPQRPAVLAKRVKAMLERDPAQAQRLLAMITEAENEGQVAANPQQKAA